jgi:hypothetical protein
MMEQTVTSVSRRRRWTHQAGVTVGPGLANLQSTPSTYDGTATRPGRTRAALLCAAATRSGESLDGDAARPTRAVATTTTRVGSSRAGAAMASEHQVAAYMHDDHRRLARRWPRRFVADVTLQGAVPTACARCACRLFGESLSFDVCSRSL